ncbi:MAG: cytidylate kinase-like family protein [Firmicutes bacterium]|nr:cytidylate kinase-like family protein [Bacillota bacterium]
MKEQHHVISIGRQLGSGGSAMGRAIAEHFGFRYIDKEILVKAAERLELSEESLELIDERNSSIWGALAQIAVYDMPYVADAWYTPTSKQLFETQTQIMREAAEEGPCVIIGRCASYLFRNYEKHTSIFLQADMDSRMARLEKTLKKPVKGTRKRKHIEHEDRERARYFNTFTGKKWLDLRGYDLVLDTTYFTDEQIEEILFQYITARFPELK